MRLSNIIFLFLILIIFSVNSYGESNVNSCSFIGKFKLRKTLDGSKNEALPAIISYEKKDEESYYNVNLASSYGSYSCGSKLYDINITPKAEYHRSTGKKEVRKSSVGINTDLSFTIFKNKLDSNGHLIQSNWYEINPYILSEASVIRDSVNDKTTRRYALLLSGYSLKQGSIGEPLSFPARNGEQPNTANLHHFKWLPFIGWESYEKLAIVNGDIEIAPAVNPTFRIAKLSIEYYPLRRKYGSKKGFQVLANHTYRRLNGLSDIINKSTRHFELSFNYFFDTDGHVGLGIDYEDGASPKRNFLNDEITTVALKLSW